MAGLNAYLYYQYFMIQTDQENVDILFNPFTLTFLISGMQRKFFSHRLMDIIEWTSQNDIFSQFLIDLGIKKILLYQKSGINDIMSNHHTYQTVFNLSVCHLSDSVISGISAFEEPNFDLLQQIRLNNIAITNKKKTPNIGVALLSFHNKVGIF